MPQPPSKPPLQPGHRIAKLLARAGVGSRRDVERMIADGRVARDGVVLDTAATVLASLAGVTVDGAAVEAAAPARLFRFHKPPGLLTAARDPAGRPTIYDRLPPGLPRVMPVGRLDLGTEGLLLLTTDGELKRQLELPATGVARTYRARAYGVVSQAQLEELIHGIEIAGVRYGAIDANLERRTGANVWIELTLTEGKNREVRRVLEHLGLRVSRLIRTRYGPFALDDLAPGAVEEVRAHDLASFRKHPTRADLPQPARRGREAVPADRPAVARAVPPAASAPRAPAKAPARAAKPTAKAPAVARAAEKVPAPPREARPAARPAKPRRVRADGSVAAPAGGKRATRARTFRAATGQPEPKPAGPGRPRRPKPRP